MAKQAKPKAVRGSNPDRPNGKAWKKSHGNNPPIAQSTSDSQRNRKNKEK